MVFVPTSIWRTGPSVLPAVTSTGVLRAEMRETTAADHKKLSALAANTKVRSPRTTLLRALARRSLPTC